MECKLLVGASQSSVIRELIDTLWNVNDNHINCSGADQLELIDTLWNVNFYAEDNSVLFDKN